MFFIMQQIEFDVFHHATNRICLNTYAKKKYYFCSIASGEKIQEV